MLCIVIIIIIIFIKLIPRSHWVPHTGRVSGRLIDKAGFVSDKVLLSALSSKLLVSTIIYSFIYYVSSFNALQ